MSKIKRGFYFGVSAAKRAAGALLRRGVKSEGAKKARVLAGELMREKNRIMKEYLAQLQKSAREFALLTEREAAKLAVRLDNTEKKTHRKKKRRR